MNHAKRILESLFLVTLLTPLCYKEYSTGIPVSMLWHRSHYTVHRLQRGSATFIKFLHLVFVGNESVN